MAIAYGFPADHISGPGWMSTTSMRLPLTCPLRNAEQFHSIWQKLCLEAISMTVFTPRLRCRGYDLVVAKGGQS